ncbi:DUF3251 domain-containing protein [Shigella flexneri]
MKALAHRIKRWRSLSGNSKNYATKYVEFKIPSGIYLLPIQNPAPLDSQIGTLRMSLVNIAPERMVRA